MNYDKILTDIFFKDDWHFDRVPWAKYKRHYKKRDKYQNIINYIENRFPDSDTFKETLYRIRHNIKERPVCKTCGGHVEFLGKCGIYYRQYCSDRCSGISPETIRKKQETDKAKHNGKLGWNSLSKEQIKIAYEKGKQTIIKKYGSLENYNKIIKEKREQTLIDKYGVPYVMQVQEIKEKRYQTMISNRQKYKTKSRIEDKSYELIKKIYPDVLREYKSELYTFHCDFYIPSLDLYIECNYHWTHGEHPYDPTNKEDLEQVEKWKLENHNGGIDTWTVRDPKKRKTAKDNNLNYLEIWNLKELKEWLKIKNEKE